MGTALSADAACDVAVIGGGPAGAAAAITLSRLGLETVVLDAATQRRGVVGETLPPVVRPVLTRLDAGILDRADVALPTYDTHSAWGADAMESSVSIFGPYGPGFHIDRERFDARLRDAAAEVGATVRRAVRVKACRRLDAQWELGCAGAWTGTLTAAAVIDASGRRAAIARSIGARRNVRDALVGISAWYDRDCLGGTEMLVEAVEDGWWYSAPLPGGRAIVVLMTDADLCRSAGYSHTAEWAAALAATHFTRERLADHARPSPLRVAWAATHRLDCRSDGSWLAAGDAAIALDPLSGSGVLRAILTGEVAANAIAHGLVGRPGPARAYKEWLDLRFREEWAVRVGVYRMQSRWRTAPFWRRRQELEDQAAGNPTGLGSLAPAAIATRKADAAHAAPLA